MMKLLVVDEVEAEEGAQEEEGVEAGAGLLDLVTSLGLQMLKIFRNQMQELVMMVVIGVGGMV